MRPSSSRITSGLASAALLLASTLASGLDLVNGLGGPAGFGEGGLVRGDDLASSLQVDITSVFPGGIDYFGTVYQKVWVNNNGNITFDGPSGNFTPTHITAGSIRIIAPFYADVDTRPTTPLTATPGGTSTGANRVWYDRDAVRGIFTVTWDDVGYFDRNTNKLNAFQLRLKRRSSGGFTIEFRYENIAWTTGDASSGNDGLGGIIATAGWSGGNGTDFFSLPQSGNQALMLDLENIYTRRTVSFNVDATGSIAPNQAPVAIADSINVTALTPRDFQLSGSDPDEDDLIYLREDPTDATKLVAFPPAPTTFATARGGTVEVADATSTPPVLRYTPPALALPFDDSFQFGVQDTFNRDSTHAGYVFHVGQNIAPVADDQTLTVFANSGNPVVLTGSDANDDVLTFAVTGGPGIGAFSGTAPALTYTPPTGTISGTATVTFTVSDGVLTDAGTLTLNIIERPGVTITSPNGGEFVDKDAPMRLTWTPHGALANVSFLFSADNGRTWQPLASNLPNTGSATVEPLDVTSSQALISAVDGLGTTYDVSDAVFSIGRPEESGGTRCGSGSGLILGLLGLIAFGFRRLGLRTRR